MMKPGYRTAKENAKGYFFQPYVTTFVGDVAFGERISLNKRKILCGAVKKQNERERFAILWAKMGVNE